PPRPGRLATPAPRGGEPPAGRRPFPRRPAPRRVLLAPPSGRDDHARAPSARADGGGDRAACPARAPGSAAARRGTLGTHGPRGGEPSGGRRPLPRLHAPLRALLAPPGGRDDPARPPSARADRGGDRAPRP